MKRVGKVSKYLNVKTRIGDKVFDSKKEASRYMLLRDMDRALEIQYLRTQVPFPITINGKKICTYIADFMYIKGEEQIIEDVKSEITRKNPVYRLKKKLVEALYNITITEV